MARRREHSMGKPSGLGPSDLPAADQPAAYLTSSLCAARFVTHRRGTVRRLGGLLPFAHTLSEDERPYPRWWAMGVALATAVTSAIGDRLDVGRVETLDDHFRVVGLEECAAFALLRSADESDVKGSRWHRAVTGWSRNGHEKSSRGGIRQHDITVNVLLSGTVQHPLTPSKTAKGRLGVKGSPVQIRPARR